MSHWIIAPVVLPAILAPLILLLARRNLMAQRLVSGAGSLALWGIALALLLSSGHNPPEPYFLGHWPAPFGIVLMLDRLSALMLLLTATLALAVLGHAVTTGWDARGRHFHALFLFQLMGLNGAFLTADAFNLFVFFEVLLIASYGLMIHGAGRDRLRAGVQYIAFNLIASTLFLFALATVYAVTGTLNMADLAQKIAALPEGDAALIRVAAVLMVSVFAIKGALVPLQFWLPGTYANAPGPVAALFAIMTKVGAYAILRTTTLIFPPDTPAIGPLLADLMLPAALATLAIGAIGTLGATTLPRLAAFAGIASMGTLFAALASFTPQATGAALYYLIHSTLATAALFLIADLLAARRADGRLTPQPPVPQQGMLAVLFFVTAIALAGMPPLSGFLGKLLILDALRADAPLVWSVILLSSFLMILGFARAGSTLFWKSAATGSPATPHPAPRPASFAATAALIAALVALTAFAGPVTGWLADTAASLHTPDAYIAANRLDGGN
ncbi:monovalent cation/H+ antiporter subunit D [Rhodobacteraceae bacterium HSP-20]|uniref:Monovalent cation/H+ antiporter subunit D n=1 Tax=Paragemmobacter amnigenus TaxID=2852097 RepID=A0ABS6JAM7_9RHOB|nr:monovalent cation/H+ antiporter subunit D [Rhodobacter amnigenus]MBU9699537.1 monovalent cation/H+ antiporter subunit D [Rhodobacter amnigenus]MBV4390764.1 monovalent cation/H+ antiporter subunit D [Rhodobacter amnigenus]